MTSKSVIIVGNGLFGSIAATLARSRGHEVTVVSDLQPLAASKASGCVLAPSWLSSLNARDIDTGLNVLRALYDVYDVEFKSNLLKNFKAQRVDPDQVLVRPDVIEKVERVFNGKVLLASGKELKGAVLVAAGMWSADLVDMPKMRGLYGASVRFNSHLPTPRIHVYAPYRQAVGFQLNRKEVWFGDGTALIRKSWQEAQDARVAKTVGRAEEFFGVTGKHRVNIGIRPYVEGHKAGYFERPHPQTWVSTGGAKNGTVLAAAQAARFIEEAKL